MKAWLRSLAPQVMTKLQVARREIDTAVKLLFDGGDPIAVMVLAAAARGIVSSLCEIAGKKAFVDLLQEDFPSFALVTVCSLRQTAAQIGLSTRARRMLNKLWMTLSRKKRT